MGRELKICLVTYSGMAEEEPNFLDMCGNDRLRRALQNQGAQCDVTPWDSNNIPWESYNAVLCRSPFDYPQQSKRFKDWVKTLQSRGANLYNKPDMLLWNMNKNYIFDLQKKGIPIPDSVFIPKKSQQEKVPVLSDIMRQRGWRSACVKPVIGNRSQNVLEVHDPSASQAKFEKLARAKDTIVQEYVNGYKNGETCLLFFNGKYSHTIKKPALAVPTFEYVNPKKDELDLAMHVMSLLDEAPLIGRVDLVRREGGGLVLGELELLDPLMYLTNNIPNVLANIIIKKCCQY